MIVELRAMLGVSLLIVSVDAMLISIVLPLMIGRVDTFNNRTPQPIPRGTTYLV